MIYPETTLEDWCNKYGIEPQNVICVSCKNIYKTITPIKIKGYVGLEMEKHGCPDNFLSATFTPTDEDENYFWENFYQLDWD